MRDCMMTIISAPSKRWVHPAPRSPVCTRQRETAGKRICVKDEPRTCALASSDGDHQPRICVLERVRRHGSRRSWATNLCVFQRSIDRLIYR